MSEFGNGRLPPPLPEAVTFTITVLPICVAPTPAPVKLMSEIEPPRGRPSSWATIGDPPTPPLIIPLMAVSAFCQLSLFLTAQLLTGSTVFVEGRTNPTVPVEMESAYRGDPKKRRPRMSFFIGSSSSDIGIIQDQLHLECLDLLSADY